MKINRLVIENFKSIERIELIEPNPFTVFVGPNGSGKSNIFEGLEFMNALTRIRFHEIVGSLFGGSESLSRKTVKDKPAYFEIDFDFIRLSEYYTFFPKQTISYSSDLEDNRNRLLSDSSTQIFNPSIHMFENNFSRVFIKNERLVKFPLNDNQKLSLSAYNLEKVLKRILSNETIRTEIFEWLELFVPGFKAIEVDDRNELHWFENSSADYFTKDLISDGTYNILALLTAVYQSDDQPQFLCIEEPENGLHPQVARELVDFFRIMCEERGHYIWLNTHSQSMVSRVRAEELVIVEKKDGATQVRQFKGEDFHGMRADEAWLTNSLGGGLAW
ncbi:AAA family ATPase [Spirosoma montaniterrae]|uniref:Chromosome segregation protein SMC n=1 Tax=Spirosoma montaniterrae TaxID=1178516 RepID=A0A1P9WUL7_9BACT|nr:ATP-binding protein [Spirosoma montaniterrae]AQG79038.1 chromosome segregation protein SMC [Spirosoma montaniterrae]